MLDKVEKCLKAQPFKEGDVDDVWEQKFYQDVMENRQMFVAVDRLMIIMRSFIDCFSEHPHQKMLLLDAMIQHLGKVDSWPSYILQHLFIDNPSPTRPKKLKRVMAFFFGNSVPLELAYEFYNACNGRHSRFVVE